MLAVGVAGILTLAVIGVLQTDLFVRAPARPGPINTATQLSGRVIFEDQPMAGAHVQIVGHTQVSITDADGRFTLPDPGQDGIISAWKDGFFIASAPADRNPLAITLRKLPPADHEGYAWQSPGDAAALAQNRESCVRCHPGIYAEWALSGHGLSAVRQHFRNLYEGTDSAGRPNVGWNLSKENPDGAGVCAACHAPTFEPSAEKQYDLRPLFAKHPEDDPGLSGVHCDYCHKVSGPAGGDIGLTHGRFGLKLLRPAEGQLLFGPLKDSTRNDNAFSAFLRDSRYCASCHEGTVFGVPVYTTYSEWQASPAGKRGMQCQHCHMKPTGAMSNVARGAGGAERDPTTLANHRFFDGPAAEMVRKSLRVDLRPTRHKDAVRVVLDIRAEDAGHRVPTGFVDRNVVVIVTAVNADGENVAAKKGPTLPPIAGKRVSGQAGRLYAKVLKDFQGRSPAPFWRAAPEFTDTRLVPGEADVTEWLFPLSVQAINVRIIHRRFWPEVAEQKGWTDNESLIVNWTEHVPP